MYIDWTKIKEGYKSFEKLAVDFVKDNEQRDDCSWSKTKDTRDKNHDAIAVKKKYKENELDVALFIGYYDNIDVWWMEAKYSAIKEDKNKIISRYRLDATIVSAVLSKNVSKVIFVTNLNISAKTISDIRKALISSSSCKEVIFYTRNHLEYWLLKDKSYLWLEKYFNYTKNDFNTLDLPTYNCIEELTFYKMGDNIFQEPLSILYTSFIYEIHYSIFVQKEFTARFKKSTNIELLHKSKDLDLKIGVNEFSFIAKIPQKIERETKSKKDVDEEYKDILPISIIYELEDNDTHNKYRLEIIPSSAVEIIDSSNFYLEIPSQNETSDILMQKTRNSIKDPEINFFLFSLFGRSGIGKSFVVQMYKNKIIEKDSRIVCNSYTFTENKLDNIKLLKKLTFNLFFPFILYEELDNDYIQKLQSEAMQLEVNKLSQEFWEFISLTEEIENFIKFTRDSKLLIKVFPDKISINTRIIILDDIQKLSKEYWSTLKNIIEIFIQHQYPIFCVTVSHDEITLEDSQINKNTQFFSKELTITSEDIIDIFKSRINIAELSYVSQLFGSVIEIVYFIKYLSTLGDEIKNIDDFRLAYNQYKSSDILKKEIISKFESVFKQNKEVEALCSCIYYSSSGIARDKIYTSKESRELIDLLVKKELIKKNDDDFYIWWHDYYKEIYLSKFHLQPYKGLEIQFKNTYDIKNQVDTQYIDDEVITKVLEYLKKLYSLQKFYDIYYILENMFITKDKREKYRNYISNKNYFLLFAYFCYANTNAGTVFSGYEMFDKLYLASSNNSDITVQTIHYIILWEIINSLYENDEYKEALNKINIFCNIPKSIKNNWIYLFEWDYPSLSYAVSTVKMFINSESGIDCLEKVPDENQLQNKDVAFSTYRLLLCNLTNNFSEANKLLRRYNEIVQNNEIYDNKTKYMYDFTIKFLDCINNEIDISDVIRANRLLKNEYFNDYNRHIFAVSILALLKRNISLCENCRMEYIKTNRPMKKRQKGFEMFYQALVNLYKSKKQEALDNLNNAKIFFQEKPTYLIVIEHNINYVNQYEFSLENITFYFGEELCQEKYYIDIRMLY